MLRAAGTRTVLVSGEARRGQNKPGAAGDLLKEVSSLGKVGE